MIFLLVMDTQAFCDDSFTAVSDSTAVNHRSNFAPEFGDRLDDVQTAAADVGLYRSHHRRRVQQQQQQQRWMSSPGADDTQRRTSSQDCDVDLSPADIDENDSMQVHN